MKSKDKKNLSFVQEFIQTNLEVFILFNKLNLSIL